MYPLFFNHILKNKIWGGNKLQDFLNLDKTNDLIGESWEISAHDLDNSIIQNGKFKGMNLQELLEKEKENLVGVKVYNKFKNKFPLLIKFLDVNDRLSIQVHPDNSYSLKKHNEFGKSECWYILDASEDATLLLDINEKYSKDDFIEKVNKNDFNGLFKEVKVKKNDFIDITPGTIHATIKGKIFFAEIQQNSDITYRIYDFDRLENGKLRPLHLEDAINVIDFSKNTEIKNYSIKNGFENLSKNEFFTLNKIDLNNEEYFNKFSESFTIYTAIEGNFKIYSENEEYKFNKGTNVLIPVNTEITIKGTGSILQTYIEL